MTQAVARRVHDDTAVSGFRWWSSLKGEWHTIVLFSDRVAAGALSFGDPVPLRLTMPELITAAAALAIELPDRA